MKTVHKTLMVLLIAGVAFTSCTKKSNPKPATKGNITALVANWSVSTWGGVGSNPIDFTIDDTGIGTITALGSQPFGFSIGDQLFTNITANTDGTFSAKGKYTFGAGNTSSGIRNCTLSLQNSNTQLTAFYPAISSSFPDLTYVFQKGTIVILP